MEKLKDNSVRAWLAIALVMVQIMFSILGLFIIMISLLEIEVLYSMYWIIGFVTSFSSLANIGAVVVFIMWLYRATVNLERISYKGLKYNSAWAIGGWFVPIASIYTPYAVVAGAYEGFYQLPFILTTGKKNEKSARQRMIGLWWALYLLTYIFTIATSALVREGGSDEETFFYYYFFAATNMFTYIGSCFFLIRIIRNIMHWEQQSLELYRSGRVVALPNDFEQRNAATPHPPAQP